MRLGGEGIPKEEKDIHLLLNDHGADLLVAAEGSREALRYRQTRRGLNVLARCAGGEEFVLREDSFVFLNPVTHLSFFRIVRDEGYALLGGEGREGVIKGNNAHKAPVLIYLSDLAARSPVFPS